MRRLLKRLRTLTPRVGLQRRVLRRSETVEERVRNVLAAGQGAVERVHLGEWWIEEMMRERFEAEVKSISMGAIPILGAPYEPLPRFYGVQILREEEKYAIDVS